jgi:hypothetical protein
MSDTFFPERYLIHVGRMQCAALTMWVAVWPGVARRDEHDKKTTTATAHLCKSDW